MEKESCWLTVEFQRFTESIVDMVRNVAATYPELQESKAGCIRITTVPLSNLADEWLGGRKGSFHPDDVCEREFVYKLNVKGSHTMMYHCEDGHIEPVNCYGYSAMKVAAASWERQFNATADSAEFDNFCMSEEYERQKQYRTADNGYAFDGGVVCTTIRLNGEDFMRLYVTISGFQKGEDDEKCAIAGIVAAQDFLIGVSYASSVVEAEGRALDFSFSPKFVADEQKV